MHAKEKYENDTFKLAEYTNTYLLHCYNIQTIVSSPSLVDHCKRS